MHLFFLLLISPLAFAQIDPGTGAIPLCTEDTFINDNPTDASTFTYDCEDVVITNDLTTPLNNFFNYPLTIRATGSVVINGNILFQGSDASAGSQGGPGGGSGGIFFGSGQAGVPAGLSGGNPPTQPSGCTVGRSEGSGGGGGSLITLGFDGNAGTLIEGDGTTMSGGTGGQTPYSLDLNDFKTSGAGGGTGEAGCENGSTATQVAGNGGGGGGGIRIISAGEITVSGTINVSGGNGGTSTTLGGGGGAGSGGVVVLQSLSKINLKNTIVALGGQGGTNSVPGSGGNGGNGAPGFILLEDQNGSRTFTGTASPPSPSKQSLNSDISCGTIAKSEESHSNALMLIVIGFLLALGTKILFQFPMKLSRKFVHRN